MADITALKNRIRAAIKSNNSREITGPVLQQALLDIVDEFNEATELQEYGLTIGGIVSPSDSPSDNSGKQVYFCTRKGNYTNFNNAVGLIPANGLYYWYKHSDNKWHYKQFYSESKCNYSNIEYSIKELLVIGASEDDQLYISEGVVTVSNNEIKVLIKKVNSGGNINIASYWHSTDGEFNKVVKFNTYNTGGNIEVYAIFEEHDCTAFSGIAYTNGALTKNAYSEQYNGEIAKYLDINNAKEISDIKEILEPPVKHWCNNNNINNLIEELYIKNATTRYPNGLYIKDFEISNGSIRFWTGETTAASDINAFRVDVLLRQYVHRGVDGSYRVYFGSNAITPIYSYTPKAIPELIGYVKFHKGTYASSSINVAVDRDFASNINNSPKIKKMLEDDRQIVLLGDSHFGYPLPNILADVIQGLTGIKTYNLGFGGCRMAWRTVDGSNDWDNFCFPEIADAIASGNFTKQIAKVGIGSTPLYTQVRNLQEIDITKPFQIILNFSANDVTGGTKLGNLFSVEPGFDISDDTKRNAKLASLDRNKFNEAFTYGLIKLFNAFPNNFTIQVHSEPWRWYSDSQNRRISPFDYENSVGLNSKDYSDALKENCRLMGIRFIDYANSGITNAFSLRAEKEVDGSYITGVGIGGSIHMEAVGISMVAQFIANEVKNFYLY